MAAYKTRVPSYLLMLLFLAFALVSFVGYQKMRDMRMANEVIRRREEEIQSLQEELQREKVASVEVLGKFEELQKYAQILRSEKLRLSRQLNEMEIVKNAVEEGQKRLQSFLQNKEDQIVHLKDWEREAIEKKGEVQNLTELLDKKEHEIKEMKARLAEFEGAQKSQNNTAENMESYKPDDVGKSQLLNATDTRSAEQNYTNEDTRDKSDGLREENMNEDSVEARAMENVERSALEDKVGTTVNDGGLHDSQLEESDKLQDSNDSQLEESDKLQDSRTRDEEEDIKDNFEEETEGNETSDDMKDLEDLELNNDDKDPEDEQGDEIDKVNDEEETDM